jgi:hypothetical protein
VLVEQVGRDELAVAPADAAVAPAVEGRVAEALRRVARLV